MSDNRKTENIDLSGAKEKRAQVAFLGVVDRVTEWRVGDPLLWKKHLIGLSGNITTWFIPVDLSTFTFVFAIYEFSRLSNEEILCIGPSGEKVFGINLHVGTEAVVDGSEPIGDGYRIMKASPHWTIETMSVAVENGVLAHYPGEYRVLLVRTTGEEEIGRFDIIPMKAPRLTEERIEAIKKMPHAAKAIKARFGCRTCSSALYVYTALERSEEIEKDHIWYEELPDEFRCECGETVMDLRYVRENFHAVLEAGTRTRNVYSVDRIYEDSELHNIVNKFEKNIQNAEREEDVHDFIKKHPIILSTFGAKLYFHKKSILGKFVTDIVIVTHNNEVLLVELERPDTPLLTKKGTMAAKLVHAFDQVDNWLEEVKDHRQAIIDSLGLPADQMGRISGIVVAGTDKGYEGKHLRKLKRTDLGEKKFYTYDDVLNSLTGLSMELRSM